MEKPLGVYLFGILYLILGIGVIVGYFYILATDAITYDSYDAGDVIYTAKAAEMIATYVLIPSIFIGGILAVPGSILILKGTEYKNYGYYLMLVASICWTIAIIGLITIWYMLKKEVRELYL